MLGSHSTTTQREKTFCGGQGEEKESRPVKMRDKMVLRTFRVGYELNTFDTLRGSPVKV